MQLGELLYVPAGYEPTAMGDATLWGRPGDGALAATLVPAGVRALERLLGHRLRRRLHVVVCASNAEACRALDRRLSPTALLAPLHTPSLALVALQAPWVDLGQR